MATNNFASQDLNISSGVMGINFVLPVYVFLTLKMKVLWITKDHGFS